MFLLVFLFFRVVPFVVSPETKEGRNHPERQDKFEKEETYETEETYEEAA